MKKILSILLIGVVLFNFNSCKHGAEQVAFYPELIKYNLYRSDSANDFSFNINITSTHKNPKIEFVSAEGVNTENLIVTFSNDSFESIADTRIDGKYVILLGVHCSTSTEYTKIDSMKLSVNGNETEIKFSTPVENTFYDYDSIEHVLVQRNMPIYIFPQSFVGENETDYMFSVEAINDITIVSFYFNAFLDFVEAEVSVNGKSKGSLKDIIPINLKQGDILTVNSKIQFANEKYTGMENLYLNLIVECISNNTTIVEHYPIVATFIGNVDDAKEFINKYVEE